MLPFTFFLMITILISACKKKWSQKITPHYNVSTYIGWQWIRCIYILRVRVSTRAKRIESSLTNLAEKFGLLGSWNLFHSSVSMIFFKLLSIYSMQLSFSRLARCRSARKSILSTELMVSDLFAIATSQSSFRMLTLYCWEREKEWKENKG